PKQGKTDRGLQHQHVHQGVIRGVLLSWHRGIHDHDVRLPAAPGAAMGGSFPGIIVPAANQLSVPQSGNWCGPESRFADSERCCTAELSSGHLKRVRVSRAVYEAKLQRA